MQSHPCKSLSPLNSFPSLHTFKTVSIFKIPILKGPSKTLIFRKNSPLWGRNTHIPFCSSIGDSDEFSNTQLRETPENDKFQELDELELLGKPSPKPVNNGSVSELETEPSKPDKDEVLAPFLKFFKGGDSLEGGNLEDGVSNSKSSVKPESDDKVQVEYYQPKPGDFVVGVVVSGNENRLDVNVGADLLGSMLTKEVLPLYDKELDYLLYNAEWDAEEFMVRGKMGIVKNEDAINGQLMAGRPVVDPGTVLFAEVLGRTLSGRPLLSTRRFFRRIAWHRVRQIKQLNEPIEVNITEWNTGGLLTRIEGLRAFLPKAELMNRVNSFTELKENVGRRLQVLISRINESTNDLILSEREAWEILHLREGTLLEGTVRKIFPYGAQIRIGETNRSGLLHISNISRARVTSVKDVLAVDEKVKVLVVKSMFPNKISLSIAELESESGLFITNKERVFSEAEEMAKKFRQKLPALSVTQKFEQLPKDHLPFEDESNLYSNWRWFKFERDNEPNDP
ncbi:S1 domain [Dillenia turbinata]|uniref:S1 domain n=1 Tax=Dillenia turbinata TaxID=194707 RepID=A0AAN8ZN63_9MAGN